MRLAYLAVLVAVTGCDVDGLLYHDSPGANDDTTYEGGGGLPPPTCGEGACSECVSCSLRDGLCFGQWFGLGVGECVATGTGSLTATIDGAAFDATEIAAVVDGAYVQVGANAGGRALALHIPAELGTHDCAGTLVEVAYFNATGDYWNGLAGPQLPCSVTLTAIGDVGGTIEGTVLATLQLKGTSTTIEVIGGTFSAPRVPFP